MGMKERNSCFHGGTSRNFNPPHRIAGATGLKRPFSVPAARTPPWRPPHPMDGGPLFPDEFPKLLTVFPGKRHRSPFPIPRVLGRLGIRSIPRSTACPTLFANLASELLPLFGGQPGPALCQESPGNTVIKELRIGRGRCRGMYRCAGQGHPSRRPQGVWGRR